jgi:hypothetical protein
MNVLVTVWRDSQTPHGKTHRKKDIDEGVKLGEYELLLVVVLNGAGSMCTSSCGAKIGVESL